MEWKIFSRHPKNRINMKKIPIDTCYFIEFLFRYMNMEEVGGKKWFLDAEQSILNKLERRIKL